MTFRSFFLLGAILVTAAANPVVTVTTSIEPVEIDPGLTYVRVTSLEADDATVEKQCVRGTALVIDVRYASANDGDGAVFAHALASHSGDAPLFVLVSPSTPAPVSVALTHVPVRFITLGLPDSVPAAKVVVAQTAEADRHAYDAAMSGKDLSKLISGKVEKDRYDEASLVSDFNNGNTNPEIPAAPDPRQSKDKVKSAVLPDRVLQRAVHLFRALAAVKPRS